MPYQTIHLDTNQSKAFSLPLDRIDYQTIHLDTNQSKAFSLLLDRIDYQTIHLDTNQSKAFSSSGSENALLWFVSKCIV
jgi:hypothetical protein